MGLVLCPGAQVCDFCILKLTESLLSETYKKNDTRLTVLSKSRDEWFTDSRTIFGDHTT